MTLNFKMNLICISNVAIQFFQTFLNVQFDHFQSLIYNCFKVSGSHIQFSNLEKNTLHKANRQKKFSASELVILSQIHLQGGK